MTDDEHTSLSSPYEASCKLSDEEKAIQEIWAEININNSWELLLIQSPSSIMALGKLMVLSLTPSNRTSVSVAEGVSLRDHKYEVDSGYLQTLLVQAVNEGRIAQEAAHHSMSIIKHDMNEIPQVIKSVLELLSQHSSEQVKFQLPIQVKRIRGIVEDSAKEADSLGSRFEKAMQLMSDRSSSIGRTGFSLLAEVKMFWSAVISFCKELSKLVQYTLDSSCNAFIATLRTQFELASKQAKFNIKQKAKDEIYRTSIAMIAYALSVRHLANAYIRYSSQFIMPQINTIARYPMLATNDIEFAKAQRQFKEYNVACERETNRITGTNGTVNKRRSILELDMGLNLHITDIGNDLDAFIPTIADFRKGRLNRSTSRMKEHKEKQKEEKEIENDEKLKLEEDKKRAKEEASKAKEEKQKVKEEENRIKEEKKRIKEEEKQRAKEEKQRAKDAMQENGEKSNSLRMKFWRRSSSQSKSPQSPESLQFPLSPQPPQLQQYYPYPQPEHCPPPDFSLQSSNSAQSPQSAQSPRSVQSPQSSQSPQSAQSAPFVHTQPNQARQCPLSSVHPAQSSLPPQSPFPDQLQQSTQFPISPIYSQPPPSQQRSAVQIVEMPEQYFQYPQQGQKSSDIHNAGAVPHSQLSEISQYVEDVRHSQSPQSTDGDHYFQQIHIIPAQTPQTQTPQAPPIQTTKYSPPNGQHVEPEQQGYRQYPEPIQSSTPLQSGQHYRQNTQPSRRGRPISYPSNFRRAEFSYSQQSTTVYPFYRTHEVEEAMQSAQYPHYSRSPYNPVSPQSPLATASQSPQSPYGYQPSQHTGSSLGAKSVPSLVLPQSPEGEKHGNIFGKLRASFSRKSKKTATNQDHEEQATKSPF